MGNQNYQITTEKMPIHRSAPTYAQQRTETEILETGIKVIDLICPYVKVVRLDCSVVLELVNRFNSRVD